MKTCLIANDPVPIRLVEIPDATQQYRCPFDHIEFLRSIGELHGDGKAFLRFLYRGVGIDRLECIFKTGIDVEPTTSTIFVGSLEKAWEYGGFPKIILGLDPGHLSQTFKEVSASITEEELARLEELYPTVLRSSDGKMLWLTRLEECDPRIGTEYEYGYARWIPSDPFKALGIVLIFVDLLTMKSILEKISMKRMPELDNRDDCRGF